VENGELPEDLDLLGNMVRDISYYNAKRYFGFNGAGDGELHEQKKSGAK